MFYLVTMGVLGARHAAVCGSGRFIVDAMIMATFGLPIWFFVALLFSLLFMLIPPRLRGTPQMWLAVGAVCAVVFFGGFIVAQTGAAHFAPGAPLPTVCAGPGGALKQ
jgi:hypothetical protein